MSLFGGIEDWIVSRLDTQISVLRRVMPIADPEVELPIVASNTPSAGVRVTKGNDAGEMTQGGDQLINVNVEIWVSATALRGGENLGDTNGLHDLFDAVHAALKEQTPTGAFGPLRYDDHDTNDVESGLALMLMNYLTIAII